MVKDAVMVEVTVTVPDPVTVTVTNMARDCMCYSLVVMLLAVLIRLASIELLSVLHIRGYSHWLGLGLGRLRKLTRAEYIENGFEEAVGDGDGDGLGWG